MSKKVVFYLPEEFADWEGALLMAELRLLKKDILVVSETGEAVRSIGGLKVAVDAALSAVTAADTEALILIGSDSWSDPAKNRKVLAMAQDFHRQGILLAAICAATSALASVGLLDNNKHTSNDLDFLKKYVAAYKGENNYIDKLAVTDGNLITASGVAPVDFTYQIMNYLKVFTDENREHWYKLFKNGTKPPMSFWSSYG